ncbi:MAG: circularly permuted type 2 ATP-grasp protein [Bacteroidota bacterium]
MEQSRLYEYTVKSGFLDEVFEGDNTISDLYRDILSGFSSLSHADFERLNESVKLSFLNMGITYAVYNEDQGGTEKIFPFDMIPRIIDSTEWGTLQRGIEQRNHALNLFISDIYNDQKILKDKVIPAELIHSSNHYLKDMEGFRPPGGVHNHISGTDLIRHKDGEMYVLEDNLRNPSGVSYVIMNRKIMYRNFTSIFKSQEVLPVSIYSEELLAMMESVTPRQSDEPVCVLLTPGQFNSAYYEHSFLAQEMGIELVEGRDLFVDDDIVYMKTTTGPIRVDVIYRRIDDDFLDPAAYNPESILGVKGLMKSYFNGNVTIINAPGNGFSDDKAVCAYVPDIINYYLNEEPLIHNVPTYICAKEQDLQYVLDHTSELVVKPVDMSGGYGVTICDALTTSELELVRKQVKANPRGYIAQPKMYLSTHMTYIEEESRFEPRHIDLRTFALMGADRTFVLPGGLTRVALKRDSLIVNSSQGGGSKDTWILNNQS